MYCNIIDTKQAIFRNVYTYMHVVAFSEGKQKEMCGGWEGGKGREKCRYILITKPFYIYVSFYDFNCLPFCGWLMKAGRQCL